MEDNDQLRESWIQALRSEDYKVVGVRDGAETLDLLRAVAPHLVILGGQLPLPSGVAILDKMQHELSLIRYIGLLVVSAIPGDLSALPSGLNVLGALAKPVPLPALVDAVRRALETLKIWTNNGNSGYRPAFEVVRSVQPAWLRLSRRETVNTCAAAGSRLPTVDHPQ